MARVIRWNGQNWPLPSGQLAWDVSITKQLTTRRRQQSLRRADVYRLRLDSSLRARGTFPLKWHTAQFMTSSPDSLISVNYDNLNNTAPKRSITLKQENGSSSGTSYWTRAHTNFAQTQTKEMDSSKNTLEYRHVNACINTGDEGLG